jgi:hypothetical protein
MVARYRARNPPEGQGDASAIRRLRLALVMGFFRRFGAIGLVS